MSSDRTRPDRLYIDGGWVAARDEATFPVYNPTTGADWHAVANAGWEETRAAVQAAAAAQAEWSRRPPSARAGFLLKAADILEERREDFADALVDESGSWVGKAGFEAGYAPGIFRAAAALAYQVNGEVLPSEHGKLSLVERQPLGVVSVITPWNFPLLLSSRGSCAALAVGNTVVLKPSEETPLTGGLLLAEVMEEAGLPPGVFNVVTCARDRVEEVGDELVSNPRVRGISFTGSTAVGREIATRAGGLLKKVCLELGGKDALIVLDDADLTRAVNAATFGAFMHQGQICMSTEKIIVHEAVADAFTERFVANVKRLKTGDPREPGNVIGPVINPRQLEKIRDQVADAIEKGATLQCGGRHDGLYYEPTVLTEVGPEMRIYREETFGPVAPVIRAASLDEAVAIANDSEYGLSAGVITRDEEKGLEVARRLHTGMAHVNDSGLNDEPHVPFGGVKASGLGRHGGRASIEAFTELRWITLERGGRRYPPPFVEPTEE